LGRQRRFAEYARAYEFTAAADSDGPFPVCVAVSRTVHSEIQSSCVYSSLWGISGEKWKPEVRLSDFSYAGYHAGEASIPNPSARWDFKRDFSAKGDGRTDDSTALLKAIQSIDRGVLFIPEGTYGRQSWRRKPRNKFQCANKICP
jgi:hypothetical protein